MWIQIVFLPQCPEKQPAHHCWMHLWHLCLLQKAFHLCTPEPAPVTTEEEWLTWPSRAAHQQALEEELVTEQNLPFHEKTALGFVASTPTVDVREVLTQQTHMSCAALSPQRSCRGNLDQPAAAGTAGVVAGTAGQESKFLTAPLRKKVPAPGVLQCSNAGRASQWNQQLPLGKKRVQLHALNKGVCF